MKDQLKITTLGGLRILLNNQPVTGFVSRKVEALLVYLAANPREHPREILGEMLWDDLSQARTMSYLRTALSSLQKQLSPFLLVTRQTIAINPESDYQLDIAILDKALDEADEKWHANKSFTRFTATQLEEALNLYQGAFLQGFYIRDGRGFEGWQVLEQERIRNRVLETLYRLGVYALDHHNYSSGITHVSHALQLDPLWEKAHRLQMQLLAQSGQRSAALAQFETCRHILDDELGVEPDDETIALYEQIQAGNLAMAERQDSPNNLPLATTPFVKRPQDLQHLSEQLDKQDCRLLTLVGQGGIGKSRLALEVARKHLNDFQHGVYFINFAPVARTDHIANTIANVLNIKFQQSRSPKEELLNYLRDREMLLVMDNLEHLLDGIHILGEILETAPDIKLLVTARERLNLHEEWLYTVEALPIPAPNATLEEAAQSPSVQLFLQTAQRMRAEFSLTTEWQPITRICRMVKGMPLAIELAASWVRMMSAAQIAAEVERGLDILTTSVRNIPERHRSIRAVFESSWEQLNDDEQRVFRQLSVFSGGFTQQAAESIVGATFFQLSLLVDKSLLQPMNGRYAVHELLRQFAQEKINQHPDEKAMLSARHSAYYAAFLHENRWRLSNSLPGSQYFEVMQDITNVWAAWDYALENRDAELIDQCLIPLYRVHDIQSRYYEGERIFRRALAQLDVTITPNTQLTLTQARICLLLGMCLQNLNEYDEAFTLIDLSLPVLQNHNADWEIRSAEACLGNIAYPRSDYIRARQHFETVRAMLEASNDDTPTYVTTLMRLSDLAAVVGEYEESRRILQDSLPLMEAAGSKQSRTRFLITLGDVEIKLGQFEQAEMHFNTALEISRELAAPTTLAVVYVSLARVAYALADYTRAEFLCRDSIALCDEIHNLWGKAFALVHLGRTCIEQGNLAEAHQHYQDGVSICQRLGSRWIMAFTLRHMGRLQIRLGQPQAAMQALHEALTITHSIHAYPVMLDTVAGLAELLIASNADTHAAAQLAAAVLESPISEYETRRTAQAVLEQIGHETLSTTGIDPLDLEAITALITSAGQPEV